MTSFTFTSEDLERVNKNKKPKDKIFNEIENFRNAPGLQTNGQVDSSKIDTLFMKDSTRCGTVTWKHSNNQVESIIGVQFSTGGMKENEANLAQEQITQQIKEFQKKHKLSDQQLQDCKSLSTQETAITGGMMIYANSRPQLADKAAINLQSDPGVPVQFTLNEKKELICKTTSKLVLDKSRISYNFDAYNKGTSDDIKTNDYIIATVEVNLGEAGKADYKPFTTCHLHAEGEYAEQLLKNMQKDIVVVSAEKKQKTSESIKEEHHKLQSEIFDLTGAATLHKDLVKDDIQRILKSEETLGSVQMLRELNSTPKLFAEVLVDRISEINKITDPKKHSQAMKQLSDNAAHFVDQPKGYMKILVNDTVKEMAKEQNINLPKEGIISKISNNIQLMLAKINVKIHGKSSDLKEQKQLIHAARTRDKPGIGR